jgi:exonuclease SbcC
MPYREASLSFDGIHVACLCGDNGNGKTALLDAITWAVWGKARARSDDELIHLGMTEMEVEFEFAAGSRRYRVIRKRSKTKAKRAGQPLLDFQIATNGVFKSIAGNSIGETERKIVEVLRMDYDTFINSSYLLQGRADEFTKAQPSKRKEVLSNILGLSRYDDLEKRAKEHARLQEMQREKLGDEIASIEREVSLKGEYEAQREEAGKAIAEVEKEQQACNEKINELIKQKAALDSKREQHTYLEERIEQAKKAVASFESQVQEHRQRIERYERSLANYDEEFEKVQERLGGVTNRESDLAKKQDGLQVLSNQIHHLASSNATLKKEMEELRKKIDMLSYQEATCPLCGTELSPDSLQNIMANYDEQGKEKKQLYRTNEEETRKLEANRRAITDEIRDIESAVKEERAQCERLAAALERERTEAETSLPKELETLRKAEEDLNAWRSSIESDTKARGLLIEELATLPELENKLITFQQTQVELTGRHERERQRLGAIQANLDRCASLEGSKKQKADELKTVAEEEEIYQVLITAFGKKGIQAMLIENAIPEIEVEANRLLSRMTHNRMHVAIESQRARRVKEGEPVETLDINISDELGTRRYEMYSGGEAFRIDFALRIALSKLLAHRAGAPLPTLIIDEGFGSQDASGREHLVEAINSVQSDFEKILVITHIDELKDVFEARIEVTKTSEGSVIEIS